MAGMAVVTAAFARLVLVATALACISAVAAQPAAAAAACVVSSASTVGLLNEARAALQAGDVDVEIETLLMAQAADGRKTEYEKFLIDSWLATAYINKRELAKAAPLLMAAAHSPCASPAQRKSFAQTAAGILHGISGRSPGSPAAER